MISPTIDREQWERSLRLLERDATPRLDVIHVGRAAMDINAQMVRHLTTEESHILHRFLGLWGVRPSTAAEPEEQTPGLDVEAIVTCALWKLALLAGIVREDIAAAQDSCQSITVPAIYRALASGLLASVQCSCLVRVDLWRRTYLPLESAEVEIETAGYTFVGPARYPHSAPSLSPLPSFSLVKPAMVSDTSPPALVDSRVFVTRDPQQPGGDRIIIPARAVAIFYGETS